MNSSFDNMRDYIEMWRVVLIIDSFYDLSNICKIHTTRQECSGPLKITLERNYVMNAGADGFPMDSYRDAFDKTRHVRFNRRYPLGSFVERTDTPFRELDIKQPRNYNNTVRNIQQ